MDAGGAGVAVVYVDLDGTLTPVDTLVERTAALVKQQPWLLVALPVWLLRGRARFKDQVARRIGVDAAALPYRSEVLEYLAERRRSGCEVVLATAAPQRWADDVAAHIGGFSAVLASTGRENLKGRRKLAVVTDHAAGRSFAYAGDAEADLPLLRAAAERVVVGRRAAALTRRLAPAPTRRMGTSPGVLRGMLRLLRPGHWPKNLLVFVPIITAHRIFEADAARNGLLALAAFCLTTSAGYVLNDALDVAADRTHASKRRRPIASGAVPMSLALLAVPALLAGAAALAVLLPIGFRVALAAYFFLTTAYSLGLKRAALLDVVTLAVLFVIRVVAGAEAIAVEVSFWLLAFSFFFFTSLAISKRCAELTAVHEVHGTSGGARGYRVADRRILEVLGAGTGLISVVVIALYTQDPLTRQLYADPKALWGLAPLVMYWNARVWILIGRGELDEDPLLFSLRDLPSQLTVAAMLGLTWWAL